MINILKSAFTFILIILLYSCAEKGNSLKPQEDVLLQKFDSINQNLIEIKKQLAEKDSTKAEKLTFADSIINAANTRLKIKTPPTPVKVHVPQPITPVHVKQQPQPMLTKKENEANIYYYKGNPKKISVEITPWINGRRKVNFYDPFGKIIYTCDDVRLSYSSVTTLKRFHDNGAVAQIEIHDNPGASMYWYDSVITFDINNEPQWKTVNKHPQESLEEAMNNKYWWNDNTGQWVKQEVVKEQPYTR